MVKYISGLILLLAIGFNSYGAIRPEIITKVSQYPNSYRNIEDLAGRVNADFREDIDKAAALYAWVALNVEYDVKSFFGKKLRPVSYSYRTQEEKLAKEKALEEKTALETLRKNKAVCHGYATLYKRLCDLCNVECVVINGVAKTLPADIGKEPKGSDHAWNAIKINQQWYLVDVTWGAGTVDYQDKKFNKKFAEGYFMMPANRFFYNHFPVDKRWLLTDKDDKDFVDLPLFFKGYLFSDDVLVKPEKGIITKLRKGVVSFKLKTNRNIKQLYFAFERDRTSSPVEVKREGDYLLFDIPVGNRRSGYLTVYDGREGLFMFKLRVK